MRFYTGIHQYYCGIDLHAKQMYTCVIDNNGNKLLHRNLKTDKQAFLKAIAPYRDDLVVSAACMCTWYWVADLCRSEQIPFVPGHALYMKAVHAAKHKHDKMDAEKIARLLRGGTLPMAYVYPEAMRATRDLLRRRTYLVRQRAERSAHIHMTCDILALTLIYEIQNINRFPTVQDFISYSRLAPAQHISAGRKKGGGGRKMGNAHLKWAFGQATLIMIRNEKIKARLDKDTAKYGKPGAMRRLGQRLARTVYYMIKKGQLFDQDRFVSA